MVRIDGCTLTWFLSYCLVWPQVKIPECAQTIAQKLMQHHTARSANSVKIKKAKSRKPLKQKPWVQVDLVEKEMQIKQSDPDLESIARRLLKEEINLQPDFQRQEVWSPSKKKKLIDTILRGWAVPPIHLVDGPMEEEVLDGQQRLTAIRDFCGDKFAIDGGIEPRTDEMIALDGLRYSDLPPSVRRKFDRYTLRTYTIVDARPAETSELFYRLNQPTSLTAGEQRNALHGARRSQMKSIVESMERQGFTASTIGFSNSRLSYDDVVARSLVTIESGTLKRKISESSISSSFRKSTEFPREIYDSISSSVSVIGGIKDEVALSFNKASLFSIIVFMARTGAFRDSRCDTILSIFNKSTSFRETFYPLEDFYRSVFLDRSSSRVTDISSVILRDFCLARVCHDRGIEMKLSEAERKIIRSNITHDRLVRPDNQSGVVLDLVVKSAWGETI